MDWRAHIARYGQAWFPGEPWVRWTFLALFALAAILRLWGLPHLPYTHDELSALVRIYPSLGETIQRGVIELDTHPPGVQVLEWAWTKAFGMDEPVVKLPFILFALAALFLHYRTALAWTSAPPALLTIALLATLQFTVLYAQIARPYAIGFFTTALLSDQLTRYLAFGRRRDLVWTGVAIVLCAYTHHFALLLAGTMAMTGLILVRTDQRRPYLVMCGLTILGYLPNIPIFLKQFALGGLSGWLRPPDRYWLPDHVHWLLHYSVTLASVMVLVLVVTLFLRLKGGAAKGPARWFLPIWGLLPLIIGYGYSVWRAPVLQYSLLLFSFPYVLFAIFSGSRSLSRGATLLMTALLALAGAHSLIYERHHFEVFRTSRYDAMVRTAMDAIAEHGRTGVLVLFDAPDPQIQFYMKQYGLALSDLPYVQLRDGPDAGALDDLLRASSGKQVVLGISNGAAMEDMARVQTWFPYILERQDHVEGQVYRFADRPGPVTVQDRVLIAEASPSGPSGGAWDIHGDLPISADPVNGELAWDFDGREFGVSCTVGLDEVMLSPDDLFEVVMEVENPAPHTDMAVILELRCGDEVVLYKGGDLDVHGSTGPVSLFAAAARSWIPRRDAGLVLKTYVHNRAKAPVRLRRLRVFRRDANPVQNALLARVDRLRWEPE